MTNEQALRKACDVFDHVSRAQRLDDTQYAIDQLYDASCAVIALLGPFVIRVEDVDDLVEDVSADEQFDYDDVVDRIQG